MENQTTKTAVESYIFKPFNLDEALKYPHLVRNIAHTNFICTKVERKGDSIGVSWKRGKQIVKWWYSNDSAPDYIHMLVDEAETITQQQPNKTVPDHYKLPNGMDIIDIIQLLGLNFNTGSALKYMGRAGKKNNESILDDLRKAQECIRREILYYEKLEEQNKQSK